MTSSKVMENSLRFSLCVFVAAACFSPIVNATSSAISLQKYTLYKELEQALLHGNSSSSIPNLIILEDAFFPKHAINPVCLPVKYIIVCDANETYYDEFDEFGFIPCNLTGYNSSFLWTEYYMSDTTTTMLYAYARSGVTLKGFSWERSCTFASTIEILLKLSSIDYSADIVDDALDDLTSQLKAYAEARDVPKVSSDYKGYSLDWNNKNLRVADTIFIIHIALLNVFIFLISLSSSTLFYNRLYDNVKDKKNPGYPFFWAVVILSVFWNVFPSWLVFLKFDCSTYISFGIMIPLQLLVAIVVKKKSTFPIPFFTITASIKDKTNTHCFNKDIFSSFRYFMNHLVQVICIWSLLITFTFIMHYFTSVTMSFYLDPISSLVKIVFIKTVIVSFIINVALLLTIDKVDLRCSGRKAIQTNLRTVLSILTILSITPLLVLLTFMLGGVIFSGSHSSNWNTLLTLIPSAVLLYSSWYTQGVLFPTGLKDKGNPAEEIVDDLEGKTTHPTSTNSPSKGARQDVLNDATPLLIQKSGDPRNYTSSDA